MERQRFTHIPTQGEYHESHDESCGEQAQNPALEDHLLNSSYSEVSFGEPKSREQHHGGPQYEKEYGRLGTSPSDQLGSSSDQQLLAHQSDPYRSGEERGLCDEYPLRA